MNPTLLSRVIIRTFQQDFWRHLSVQSSVNKSSNSSNKISHLYRKIENRSTNFPLFKQPFHKSLCNAPLPICTSFHRNFIKKIENPIDFEISTPPETLPKINEIETTEKNWEEVANVTEIINHCAESMGVKYAESVLIDIHNATGLPWWTSIALTAVLFRTTMVLPFSVHQVQIMGKLQMVTMHMNKFKKGLKEESVQIRSKYGWPEDIVDEKYKDAIKKERERLIKKEDCHPMKTLNLIVIQVPTWTLLSLALAHLTLPPGDSVAASDIYTQLSTGGFGWITDLTAADPTHALPLMLGIVYFLTIEVHRMFRVQAYTLSVEITYLLMQCVNILLVGLSMHIPSALCIYWLSSALYGLIQAFILNTQTMYRLLNIPVLNTPMEHPHRLFKENLKNRFKKKEKKPFATCD